MLNPDDSCGTETMAHVQVLQVRARTAEPGLTDTILGPRSAACRRPHSIPGPQGLSQPRSSITFWFPCSFPGRTI